MTSPAAFASAILLAASISAHASPGANVPWTTYEAENMTISGGTLMGPGYTPNTVEAESSGRECVKLTGTGQYVELAAQAAANSIVVRYSVPDSLDGVGIDSTISLYKNGVFIQKLPMTSKYSWLYGGYPFSNAPQYSPRNFYDEARLLGITINAVDKIRIQKDADDTAAYEIIDLVDLENVSPALSQPANSFNVKNSPYNAVGDGTNDDTTALQHCINDAVIQGKTVWVPPGNYKITADINNLQNVTIQGAGMWYTTFVGDPTLYNASSSRRVRFNGSGSNVHFNDFAIIGKLNYRGDSEANDGFSEVFGTNSSISRVWVEHTKTGAWIANASRIMIDDCRIRNTIADGVNLSVGVQNSTVTNCTTRGTGDDCFPMWPATYRSQDYAPGLNVITHCRGELAFLANGGALYGGISNRIEDCLFQDMPYGCGILISGTFPVGTNVFSGATTVQRCDLIRCGGYDPGYQWRAAFQFTMENHPISNMIVSNVNIIDSISDGVSIIAGDTLNASIYNLNIPDFGLGALGRHALWAQSGTSGNMTVNTATLPEPARSDSSNSHFTLNNITLITNAPVVPTGLAATLFNSQTTNTQITLSWQPSQFATSYYVKRSTVNGGPYATIATTTTSGYVDTSVTNGAMYYYVVSGLNTAGESADSGQATRVSTGGVLTFSSGAFADNTVLNLIGTPSQELYGISLGNTTTHTTANGYTFFGYPSGHIAYGDVGSGAYGGFLGGGTSGDANFNSVLDNAELGIDNGTLLMNNLTPGTTYNILFLEVDSRAGIGTRTFNITSGNTQSPTQPYAYLAGTPALVGGYILCTFTATAAATQTFTTAQQTSYQLNAVIVGTLGPKLPAAAPSNLSAIAGNGQVALTWAFTSGAASYNLKRSTTNGGSYTTITNVTTKNRMPCKSRLTRCC